MLQSLYEGNISTFPVRFLANFFTQLLKTFRASTLDSSFCWNSPVSLLVEGKKLPDNIIFFS